MSKAYNFLRQRPGYLKKSTRLVAEIVGCTDEEVIHARKQLRNHNDLNRKDSDIEEPQSHDFDITLEDFCDAAGLDPNLIDKYNDVKYWVRGNNKIGFTILPKVYKQQAFIDAIKEHLDEYNPPEIPRFQRQSPEKNCAIINLTDAHIDKISFTDPHTTINDNIGIFMCAFDKLLHSCVNQAPEEIIIPTGSDFWNANDDSNMTKGGTPQDVLTLSKQSFKIGTDVWRKCIDKAKQYTKKVVVPIVEGNHDQDKVFYLGEVLKYLYENDDQVEIINTGTERKYCKYGKNLFGFAHGKIQRGKTKELPLVMLEENQKNGWAQQTDNRIFFLGDIHHKQEYQFLRTKDFPGIQVKFLRAISPTGNWEHNQGYVGVPKSAEAFVFNWEGDFAQNFQTTIK